MPKLGRPKLGSARWVVMVFLLITSDGSPKAGYLLRRSHQGNSEAEGADTVVSDSGPIACRGTNDAIESYCQHESRIANGRN